MQGYIVPPTAMKLPFSPIARLVALVLVLAGTTVTTQATFPTQITFSELSERPLDGVYLNGVTFHFTGSNSFFPVGLFGTTALSYGNTTLMGAPWAAGSSDGLLRLDFSNPVSGVAFAAGLATTVALSEGFRVNLYRDTQLLNSVGVATSVNGPNPLQFSEAAFSYVSSGVPFNSVTVTFSPGLNFALDNLNFAVVPEPGTFGCVVAVLAAIGLARRRRPVS